MTWVQRLKRIFNIDVSVCPKFGGEAKVIASIEDQQIIDKIRAHLMKKGALPPPPGLLSATRASPDSNWFVSRWVFTLLYTVQQQKDWLPSGGLPELRWKARKAVEEGGSDRTES